MSKNGAYPSKHVRLLEIFHKEKYLSLEKVILIAKFANHYKTGYIVSFLTRLKKIASRKHYTHEWDCYSI